MRVRPRGARRIAAVEVARMGSMTFVPLLLALAAVAADDAPAATPGDGRIVEQVVAVVRNPPGAAPRVVTLTKLVEEARIALVARGAIEAAFRPLDAEALRAALDWLLSEMVVADEAARLHVGEVDRELAAKELRRFEARLAAPGALDRFLAASELGEDELAATLARSLRVQRYLASRVGGGAHVADDEVDAYVRARGLATETHAAREVVREELAEARARAQVKELVSELRGRAEIRILDPELRPRAGGR
jgi:hypothetical protein